MLTMMLGASLIVPATASGAQSLGDLVDDLGRVRAGLDAANAQLMSTREQRVVLQGQIAEVGTQIDGLRSRISAAQAEIDRLVAEREEIRRTVRARALVLYQQRRPAGPTVTLDFDSPMDLARRQVLGRAAAREDEDARIQLGAASDALATARDQLAAERARLEGQEAELASRRRQLDDLDARIRSQQAELDAKARDLQQRIQAAIAAGIIAAGGPSLVGPTALTAAQMAAWWRSVGYGGYSVSVPIETLAQIYVSEGNAEGVRGDLAFAQAVVETGGFRYTNPGNNFAGMGWCDSCSNGRRFPTPTDGVRAQIQHLRNYGDPASRAANLAHPPSPYWYAPTSLDPAVAAANFDSFFAKGWALTWNQMGRGNWATDPGYAQKVLTVYGRMVAFATGN
jgi:predicted  nucleic acid-binding Zn-ribbon protein